MGCCFSRRRWPGQQTEIPQEPPPQIQVLPSAQIQQSPSEMSLPPLLPLHPLEEVINKNVVFLDNYIMVMDKFLNSLLTKGEEHKSVRDFVRASEAETSSTNSSSGWDSFAASGEQMLEYLNKKMQAEESTATQLFNTGRTAVVILQILANLHWTAGVLAVIAYVLDQIHEVSDNRTESIRLLKQMVSLAKHIRTLHNNMPEEGCRFRNGITTIFEGSMMCASLLRHKNLFGFLRASVDSTSLKTLSSEISHLYQDLILTVIVKMHISGQSCKLSRSSSNPESGALNRAKDMLL